jgi:hypothetical protein
MNDDLPEQIEKDDEKFMELMDCQDPEGIAGLTEDAPNTIEEKYEKQITMDKVIKPMLDRIFSRMESPSDDETQ